MERDREGRRSCWSSAGSLHVLILSATHTHTSVGINVLIRPECDESKKTDEWRQALEINGSGRERKMIQQRGKDSDGGCDTLIISGEGTGICGKVKR